MILEIDGLKLPASISTDAELFNTDSNQRTVSGRLITKLSAAEKWRVTIKFSDISLALNYQAAFYEKCLTMRSTAKEIKFVNPYTGENETITAKCISRISPKILGLINHRPQIYGDVGAVFEEV